MRTVKMTAIGVGEKEFSPEHALNILKRQVENHIPEKSCWKIVSSEWTFQGGKLTLKKEPNGDQSNTGIGVKTPKRESNTKGVDPQP